MLKGILRVSIYTKDDFNYFQGYCTGGDTTVGQIERALHIDPAKLTRTTALKNLKYVLEDAVHCPGKRRVLEYALSKPVPSVSNEDLSNLTLETTGSLIDGQYVDTSEAEIYFVYLLHHRDIGGTIVVDEYRKRISHDPFLLLLFEFAQELHEYIPRDSTLVRIAERITGFSEANVAKVFGHGYSNVGSQVIMAAYSRFREAKSLEVSSDSVRMVSVKNLLSDERLLMFYRLALTKGSDYNRSRSLRYLKEIFDFIGHTKENILNEE